MKKILLTTTALVATAGMAAAEINLGGSARFGLVYNDSAATETQLHNRFTLNIDGSTETDAGVSLFARVRVRGGNTGDGATSASGVSAPRVGMSTGGMTLAVGNINGALESMPGLYGGAVGLTGVGWGNVIANANPDGAWMWDSFSSAGGGSNGAELIYSMGDFGLHVSHSPVSERTAAHISYNFGDWTAAVAVQEGDAAGEDMTVVTLGGSLGDVNVGLSFADFETGDAAQINGSFSLAGGTTVTVYATSSDMSDDAYGLGFTHSLGGATLAGGISNTYAGATVADLGVRFGF